MRSSIPEGTQPGTSLRIRGKGMPNVSGRGHGDLHVIVGVQVPKKPSREMREALEALRTVLPADTGRRRAPATNPPKTSRSSSA